MRKYLAALGYAAFLSCSSEPLTSGTVAQKWHEPERVYSISGEDYWTGEKKKKFFIDDEDYIIILQQFGGTKFKQTRERQLYVNKGGYDALKVGDRVDLLKSRIWYRGKDKDVEKK